MGRLPKGLFTVRITQPLLLAAVVLEWIGTCGEGDEQCEDDYTHLSRRCLRREWLARPNLQWIRFHYLAGSCACLPICASAYILEIYGFAYRVLPAANALRTRLSRSMRINATREDRQTNCRRLPYGGPMIRRAVYASAGLQTMTKALGVYARRCCLGGL